MTRKLLRDVVIILPGITGSVLQKDGHDVWAASGQAAWGVLSKRGAALDSLILGEDDPERMDIGDGVQATELMPDVHLFPGLVKIDGYSKVVRLVSDTFEILPGSLGNDVPANFFPFPYDWRRDNRVTARRLKRLVDERLTQWRTYSGASDARVILLAHSMGGLVARYYLEVLEGWTTCRALITFGTPFRGSINALNFLVNGYRKLFVDATEVMRSFTSIYQLLPIYPCVWSEGSWTRVAETAGIPGVDIHRAQQALAFHREIEAAVADHRQDVEYLQKGYVTIPIVGTDQRTLQSAGLAEKCLTVSTALPAGVDDWLQAGDGTVPRASAIPIELSDEHRGSYLAERHSSLQCHTAVLNDLRGRLEQLQAKEVAAIRGPGIFAESGIAPALSVDLQDLYEVGEPVEVQARLINAEEDLGPIEALIEPARESGSRPVRHTLRREGDGWVLRTVEPWPAGVYRIQVRTAKGGLSAPSPVHDVFAVGS